MSGQNMLRNASIFKFEKVLDAIVANAVAINTRTDDWVESRTVGATRGSFRTQEAPFTCYRAFLGFLSGGAYAGSAADKTAVIDVVYWPNKLGKGIKVARLTLTAGADNTIGEPGEKQGVSVFYECDTVAIAAAGLLTPIVRSAPDGQMVFYLPNLEAAEISLHAVTVAGGGSNADRVTVYAKPAWTVPDAMEIPFKAGADISGSTPADKALTFVYGGLGASNMTTGAGSGWEYVVRNLVIVSDAAITAARLHTATSAGGVIWGPFGIPANAPPLLADELRAGDDGKLYFSSGAVSGTARIEVSGVRRPVWC